MYKSCNVVLLTTEKRSNIQMCSNDTLFWHDKPIISTKIGNGDLYITSDKEIEEGDWCYNSKRKSIESGKYMIGSNEFIFCKKIIATTDTSLGLPQLPQQFIEKYIEEYNKGNVITKVMVEYVQVPNSVFIQVLEAPYIQLKINSDNTINIKPIKDSWDLNEIKVFAVKCFNAGRQYQIDSIDTFNDNWIEENL